jgi:hypothetical protein
VLFEKIKQINHELAIIVRGGDIAVRPLPNLGSEPKALDLGGEGGSSIASGPGTVPAGNGGGEKVFVEEPCIFEPEDRGGGDYCGGGDDEGDVIGCGAGKRGERGVREQIVPRVIEKNSIEMGQDRLGLVVRPCEKTIEEGKLK